MMTLTVAMPAKPTIEARYEGDEVRCGQCGRVVAMAVVPSKRGARVPCKSCGDWVDLPLRGD